MSLERFRALFGEVGGVGDPTPREVAEVLWLATRLPVRATAPETAEGGDDEEAGRDTGDDTRERPPAPAEVVPVLVEPPNEPEIPVFAPPPPTPPGGAGRAPARHVRLGGEPRLPARLDLLRALRPFKKRVPVAHSWELDEEATAQHVAEHRFLSRVPVLRPTTGRWLDVVLVVDGHPTSLMLWEPLAQEVRRLLEHLGAFRDVRVRYLHAEPGGAPGLTAHVTDPASRSRDLSEVRDRTGRRLVLLLTDGVAPAWRHPGVREAVRQWASAGPVAVLQVLPEHLWHRTALPVVAGRLRRTGPSAANADLAFTGHRRRTRTLAPGSVVVPLLEIAPDWVRPWAELVAATGDRGIETAVAVFPPPVRAVAASRDVPAEPPGSPGPAVPPESAGAAAGPAGARARAAPHGPGHANGSADPAVPLQAFHAAATPEAFKLATLLSVVPLNVTIMRIVQEAMLPGSPPTVLAEVLFSGLIQPLPVTGPTRLEDVPHEFVPGVRAALFETLRTHEAERVLAEVTGFVERHSYTPVARVSGLIADPSGLAERDADGIPWARLHRHVLSRLGLPAPPAPAPPAAPAPAAPAPPRPGAPAPGGEPGAETFGDAVPARHPAFHGGVDGQGGARDGAAGPGAPRADHGETHLRRHFLPLARGGEEEDARWHFSGRREALSEIVRWLRGSDRPSRAAPMLAVTAGPGSGKSAVLGMVALLADPRFRPEVPLDGLPATAVPDDGAVDAALHVRGLTDQQVLGQLAATAGVDADTVEDLVTALDDRAGPFTAVVDGIDEALTPHTLIDQVLLPLVWWGEGRLRLLVGTRRHLVSRLDQAPALVIDLDDPRYADQEALAGYTGRLLRHARPGSPFREAPDPAVAAVAAAVAAAAAPSFLVARIVATTLAAGDAVPDPADQGWRESLPSIPGEALRFDLASRLGEHAARVEDLLRPLAYTAGEGLPGEFWAPLASRLAGERYTRADVEWLRGVAGSYVVDAVEDGRPVHRLYHAALRGSFQEESDAASVHGVFTSFLLGQVGELHDGVRLWETAHPYTLRYLAAHAAAAGRVDRLVTDVDYLANARPEALLTALGQVTGDYGRRVRAVYQSFLRLHPPSDGPSRRESLCGLLERSQPYLGAHNLEPGAVLGKRAVGRGELGHWRESHTVNSVVYERRRRKLGDDHPDTLAAGDEFAVGLYALGRRGEALTVVEDVYARRCRVLGYDDPATLTSQNNLATLMYALGRRREAANLYRDVYGRRRQVLGDDDPDTLTSKNNLATTLFAQGKRREAANLYRDVLERRGSVLGERHPDTLTSAGNLASTLLALGRRKEAHSILGRYPARGGRA
ncbi:tetratricopeptide repeat protein [Sphaerisporangium sp. TRM90804]|uniref:tetratricopeptide repeat protein n=1 Tax=Sphaerisporangium sp. TRM90804 TaxID=3031113 RepID=UPI00244CC654|nr:tetratricopeptide repeat protein [Sphaerisporangium sp. TRM90804]MDH2424028.1 tetratricopeptide repeat protein [Sphaerisporangium sp. TRM90804]